MAVLSVLVLPNMRTTRETNAESLTAGSSALSPGTSAGAGAAVAAFGLGVDGPD